MSTEGLGKWDDVDRAELHTGITAVLGHLLETDHVISTVDPNQVYEVALEPNRRLKFHCGKQESSVSRNGDHFLAGTDQASSNGPRQAHTKRLLPVGHEDLPGAKAVEITGQPNVERPHIQTQCHVVAEQCLKFVHETHGMDGHPIQDGGPFGEYGPVAS